MRKMKNERKKLITFRGRGEEKVEGDEKDIRKNEKKEKVIKKEE